MLKYGPIQWKNHASIVVMSLQIRVTWQWLPVEQE